MRLERATQSAICSVLCCAVLCWLLCSLYRPGPTHFALTLPAFYPFIVANNNNVLLILLLGIEYRWSQILQRSVRATSGTVEQASTVNSTANMSGRLLWARQVRISPHLST